MDVAQLARYKAREKACRREVPPCELEQAGVLAMRDGRELPWLLLQPGIAVVRDALTQEEQRQLITLALTRFPFEHVSNLSKDYRLTQNLWEMYTQGSTELVSQRPQHERERFLRHPPPCKLKQQAAHHTGGDRCKQEEDGGDRCKQKEDGGDTPAQASRMGEDTSDASVDKQTVADVGGHERTSAGEEEQQAGGGKHVENSREEDVPARPQKQQQPQQQPQQPQQQKRGAGETRQSEGKDYGLCKPENTKQVEGRTLLPKLRSLNMGFRFNWFTRTYDEHDFAPLPREIIALFQRLCADTKPIHGHAALLQPEAVVVNYYKHNDRMMGHVDDSEECEAPLLSLSLGAGCLFLCGSEAKCAHLRSGDLLIMFAPARQARHSVPRILPLSAAAEQLLAEDGGGMDPAVAAYIRKTGMRININCRQVKRA